MAKPYGSANQKLCHIQICKSWKERRRLFLRMVDEYRPWLPAKFSVLSQTENIILVTIISLSADAFILVRFKILMYGKELK